MEQFLPPDDERARKYAVADLLPLKVLLEDGSVVSGVPVTLYGETVQVTTRAPLTASAPQLVEVGVVSRQIVAANPDRKGLELVNSSLNYISISFGSNDAVLYGGKTLAPNGTFAMDEYDFTTEAVNAVASGVASNLGIQEFE